MKIQTTIEKTAERFGLMASVGLIVLFLIMKFAGLAHLLELRALNFFIMTAAIVRAEKYFKEHNPDSFTYFKGLALGMLTGAIAAIIFGLFTFIYVQFLDPAFMQFIIDTQPMGRFLNPYFVSITIAVEGIASSLIIAFITMNYLETVEED